MEAGLPVDRLTRADTKRPKTGIVHLGLGAFFRGFGCVYTADAMTVSGGDWGIVGVSLRSPAVRDALAVQDWVYTSVTLARTGEKTRVIDVLNGVLVAPEDPAAVLEAMGEADVKIVSLTVTEKGYCHNPATGALNPDHPDILHDLANPLPVSAPGFLVRALQKRRDAGLAPFTVLSCDNLPENGKLVRGIILDLARRIDPALADWIADQATFPSTMVDRITPATTDDDIVLVARLTGYHDAAPVMHEPFSQWAIEDHFVGSARPDWAAAGAEMVSDVTPHEDMKLRMLNGTHSALAYLGYLGGYETISAVMQDASYAGFVRQLWAKEIAPCVTAPEGVSLDDYAKALADRYANPAIKHRTWQIAMDGSQKLPQRIIGTLAYNMAHDIPSPGLCLAVAAWIRYVSGTDEAGQPIDVRDPMAERLREVAAAAATPAEKAAAVLAMTEIFPPKLVAQIAPMVISATEQIWRSGARQATAKLAGDQI
jgi:fructuronate reductase